MKSTMRASAHAYARPLMICLVTALAWLISLSPAAGHDQLLSTDPADAATLAEPPSAIRLTFSAAVIPMGSEVAVTGPEGPVAVGPLELANHDLVVSLEEIPPGQYDVAWRAVSSDGHPISGSFGFTVAGETTPSPTTAPPADTPAPERSEAETQASPWPWVAGAAVVVAVVAGGLLWRRSRT